MSIKYIRTILAAYTVFTSVCFAETKYFSNHPIQLEITTHLGDKQTFKQGDVVSFMVSLDKAAYLTLIYQDAKGNLIQILPNKLASSNFYESGLFLAVPNNEQPFRFSVSPPFGTETVWGFASSKPFPKLPGKTLQNGFVHVGSNINTILKKLRPKQGSVAYGETRTTLNTMASQP